MSNGKLDIIGRRKNSMANMAIAYERAKINYSRYEKVRDRVLGKDSTNANCKILKSPQKKNYASVEGVPNERF